MSLLIQHLGHRVEKHPDPSICHGLTPLPNDNLETWWPRKFKEGRGIERYTEMLYQKLGILI